MIQIGLDVHTDNTMIAWLDEDTGESCGRPYQVPTRQVAERLAALPGPQRVAMEVSGVALALARQLQAAGAQVLVVDAFKSSRLLGALHQAKTDRLDAAGLLQCLLAGQLDHLTVWVADEQTQRLRDLTRTREDLMEHSSALCCQLRTLITRSGERCPKGSLLGKRTSRRLDQIETRLAPETAQCLREYRAALGAMRESMRRLEAAIRQAAHGNVPVQRLKTLFGCATLTAVTLVAEIGDITRFADARHLRSYAGVTPTVRQSGERRTTGPLTKRGNPHLRRILILLSNQFTRYLRKAPCPMARRWRRVFARRGPHPAKVSVARDLCDLIFALWRDDADFDPARLGVTPTPPVPAGGAGTGPPPAPGGTRTRAGRSVTAART